MLKAYTLGRAFSIFLFSSSCYARVNTGRAFTWGFTNASVYETGNLVECDTMDLSVSASESAAMGPYYILAFEAGGVSTTSLAGVGAQSPRWQVNHPTGSQLLLSMIDSKGNSGGVLHTLFTVQRSHSNTTPSCLPPPPTSRSYPKIASNTSDRLEACGSWGISVTSGVPPYSISFAALGSGDVFNYSAAPRGENSFSSINNAALRGKGQVLASVSDATGVFGWTTDLIDVDDTPCLHSMHSQAAVLSARSSSHISNRATTIIIAVCTSVGGALLLTGLVLLVLALRRRRRGIIAGQDALPRPYSLAFPLTEAELESLPVIDISSRNNSVSLPSPSPAAPSKPRTAVMTNFGPAVTPGLSPPSMRSLPPAVTSGPSHSVTSPTATSSYTSPTTTRTSPSRSRTMPSSYSPARTRHRPSSNSSQRRPSDTPLPSASGSTSEIRQTHRSRSSDTPPKRHLYTSRSTGDIYRAATAAQGGYPPPVHTPDPPRQRSNRDPPMRSASADAQGSTRPTNHLRHYNSASPVVSSLPHRHRHRETESPIIIQHRDAGGVGVNEPPPPYHRFRLET
ncbi:hypothetical protein BV22DRAFT_1133673 [Leucogyrophana mollusca]|uniref:Uncharacterized protein n=1 Tax=Leucogyrophana mollusca TaxID=85980 RepID=A0ACB8B1Y3_9AGAM|nr:hypothetical protein BV22DRAFT_1133673 [Leucogyrophana mollusca]